MEGVWLGSYIVLWVMMLVQFVLLFALMRQVGLLHLRIQPAGARTTDIGPEIGTELSQLYAEDIRGSAVRIAGYGRAQLLLFISPSCAACQELLPAVKTLARSERQNLEVILVTSSLGSPGANRASHTLPALFRMAVLRHGRQTLCFLRR